MKFTEFRAAALAVVPNGAAIEARTLAGQARDEFYAFGFVSAVVAPAYLSALRGDGRLDELAALVESGLADGDDDVVNALAMRIVERHLCRDHALLAAATAAGGPSTRRIADKLGALIAEADAQVAAARGGSAV